MHQHPQYQGPIILDVLPEELGEAAWVREHLDEVQQLWSQRGVALLAPADP